MRKWTAKEDALLARLYPSSNAKTLEKRLKRPIGPIYQRAAKLGLKKSPEYMDAMLKRVCTNLRENGKAHRFQSGIKPWNVGKRGVNGFSATRFKPGQAPHNTQPIGTEKTDKSGNLLRKVADTRIRRKDWRPVHVLIWEEINGPVPEGKLIVFADRNNRNFDPKNLICIDRRENMERNSVHRLPKELEHLVILRGALNRQINKRAT